MKTRPISEMSNLAKRLGKSGVERIQYHQKRDTSYAKGCTNVDNTVLQQMQYCHPNRPSNTVDDLLSGAATNFSNGNRPLNLNRLYTILQTMPVVNTREVIKLADISERQAQAYVRAIKFVLPYLEEHFRTDDEDVYEVSDENLWDSGDTE